MPGLDRSLLHGDAAMLHSRLPHLVWPALPAPFDAQAIALLHQFETTQWWTAESLRAHQFRQLRELLAWHARATPFFAARLGAFRARIDRRLTPSTFRLIPELTRATMREAGEALFCPVLPPGHEQFRVSHSSGSSGAPVSVRKTEINDIFHAALGLRDHVWSGRDFSRSFAAIRRLDPGVALPPQGSRTEGGAGDWATGLATGSSLALNSAASTVAEQLDWLDRVRPGYILSYPSLLAELARAAKLRGMATPWLAGVSGFGEVARAHHRAAIADGFGVPLRDTYTASEVSTIALDCPDHPGGYHVMSESLLAEILDEEGEPCTEGVPGRVVVTDLHNLATPLIRYAIGDLAAWGPACPCGRGLPVMSRVVGRTLHVMRLPDGGALMPDIERQEVHRLAPVREIQVVQTGWDEVEVRLVAERALDPAEEAVVAEAVRRGLHGRDVTMRFVRLDAIPRAESGKFEAFRCAINF
jgi:phenylacetate-CoA ligase